jgi:glycosyltransferase involved in cell wall biosynthesis
MASARKPIRVCLVAPLPPACGGVARWASIIQRCAAGRRDVQIYVINTAIGWRDIHGLNPWNRVLRGAICFLRDISRTAMSLLFHRADVVHRTTSGHLAVFADLGFLMLARLLRIPLVYHIRFGRVPEIAGRRSWEWRWISRALRLAHTVVAIDRATEVAITHHLPHVRLMRIPNCIVPAELPSMIRHGDNGRTVLYLGWVVESKGMEELFAAWGRLDAPGWCLRIVGPFDPAYRNALLERHRPKHVEFSGEAAHDDAMRAVATADLFVLPSHSECFPNSLLEAMALSKAIVATDVGAISDMLAHDCGILVAPRQIDELADALALLMNDEQLRSSLGSRARDRAVREYAAEPVLEQLVSVWQDAVERTDSRDRRHFRSIAADHGKPTQFSSAQGATNSH